MNDQIGMGGRLKKLRVQKTSHTQDGLAGLLGIKADRYKSWERGVASPPLEYCVKLAELYDVSLDCLIRGEEKTSPTITPKEESLLRAYRDAGPQGKLDILFAALHAQESRE